MENQKQSYPMIQQFHSWAYIPTKPYIKKIHAPLCAQQHFSQQPRQKQPESSLTEEWIKKTVAQKYTMEYYSAMKKNEIMAFVAAWMDLEITILSEVSQRKTNTI